ncbi:hypothetical protein [Microbacterium lacticum]|uniref:hypothetical protein n=1 Tax=Microbacterium lacticum TaxID=33885 RepID=UPI001F50D7B9|nr:hypothetical protein [Microbacterium lacticum]
MSIALHVNATNPTTAAPARRLSVTPVMPAINAATESTTVAIGGRHAKMATANVMVVVTIAETTLLATPVLARKSESITTAAATRIMTSRRANGRSGSYAQKGVRT